MWKRKRNLTPPSILIVGLGNPGDEYRNTRHNAGFLAVEAIAQKLHLDTWKMRNALEAEVIESNVEGNKIVLAKPQTYMNLSGQSVQKLLQSFGVTTEHAVIIYDDITLPVGEFDIRSTKSGGGHNGLKSIAQHVEEPIRRVRVGVGAVPDRWKQSDWVLSKFTKEELNTLEEVFDRIYSELL